MNKIKMVAIAIFASAGILIPAVSATAAPSGVWTGNSARDFIIRHESGGNPNAVNPSSGARGLYQCNPNFHSCPAVGDVAGQHAWGQKYVNERYGSWQNAYAFWTANHWW